jgi:hypothetical protein
MKQSVDAARAAGGHRVEAACAPARDGQRLIGRVVSVISDRYIPKSITSGVMDGPKCTW